MLYAGITWRIDYKQCTAVYDGRNATWLDFWRYSRIDCDVGGCHFDSTYL